MGLWRKVTSNNFWEFSFWWATCEISQPQTSVGGHYSVQSLLRYTAFYAHLAEMYSEHANMCVFLCRCVPLVGAMTVTWTSELFIVFLWRYHREPKNKTIYTAEIPCTLSPLCVLSWCGVTRKLSVKIHQRLWFHLFVCTNVKHLMPTGISLWCYHDRRFPSCISAAVNFTESASMTSACFSVIITYESKLTEELFKKFKQLIQGQMIIFKLLIWGNWIY